VVDDNFVATIGTERCLNSLGDGSACIDVANDCSIFCVVAGGKILAVTSRVIENGDILLVTLLEQARIRRLRDGE